jgi:hypothetical protein
MSENVSAENALLTQVPCCSLFELFRRRFYSQVLSRCWFMQPGDGGGGSAIDRLQNDKDATRVARLIAGYTRIAVVVVNVGRILDAQIAAI